MRNSFDHLVGNSDVWDKAFSNRPFGIDEHANVRGSRPQLMHHLRLQRQMLWSKPLDLRLERGFDRPVGRLNGDHARPGIGDTASLADALDLCTLHREFASAQH